MPDPQGDGRRGSSRRPQGDSRLHRRIANLGNGRLHLALLVTMGAAFLIALAVPIRIQASDQGVMVTPLTSYAVLASPETQPSLLIQRQQAVPFTVHEQGFVSFHLSSDLTVGQALASLGITIGPYDLVSPAPETALTSGLHVYVQHASRVDLSVGGEQQTVVYTHAATVGALLEEVGVTLEPLDRVSPDLGEPIRHGMKVDVTIIREAVEYVDELLPFDVIYWDDPNLVQGAEVLTQAGSNGYVRREYRIRHENGVEVGRELIGETTVPPTDQIIKRGTYVSSPTMSTPEGDLECVQTMNVFATWYTAASAGGIGITRTGTGVYKGIVAVDPSVIPLGTRMYIPGYGYGLAADTGGGIIGNWIDLGYGPDDVYDWPTGWVEICILE